MLEGEAFEDAARDLPRALRLRLPGLPTERPDAAGQVAGGEEALIVRLDEGAELRRGLARNPLAVPADAPLGRTIAHLAAAVAYEDPRFPAVSPFEVPFLQIEISLLTPERPIGSIEEIEVGLPERDNPITRIATGRAGEIVAHLFHALHIDTRKDD